MMVELVNAVSNLVLLQLVLTLLARNEEKELSVDHTRSVNLVLNNYNNKNKYHNKHLNVSLIYF